MFAFSSLSVNVKVPTPGPGLTFGRHLYNNGKRTPANNEQDDLYIEISRLWDHTRAQVCDCQFHSCSNRLGDALSSLNVSRELIDFRLGKVTTPGCRAAAAARCGTCNLLSSILEVNSNSFEVCADSGSDVHAGKTVDVRSGSLNSLVYLQVNTRFSWQMSVFLLPEDATSAAMTDC